MPKCLTLRSRSFIAPICSGSLAQSFSTGPVRMTRSLAFNTTLYTDLTLQSALCSSSKPLQVDRRGLGGFFVFQRPQELQGGSEVCRLKDF